MEVFDVRSVQCDAELMLPIVLREVSEVDGFGVFDGEQDVVFAFVGEVDARMTAIKVE